MLKTKKDFQLTDFVTIELEKYDIQTNVYNQIFCTFLINTPFNRISFEVLFQLGIDPDTKEWTYDLTRTSECGVGGNENFSIFLTIANVEAHEIASHFFDTKTLIEERKQMKEESEIDT